MGFGSVSTGAEAVKFDRTTYGRAALETCLGALAERREGIDQFSPSGEMVSSNPNDNLNWRKAA